MPRRVHRLIGIYHARGSLLGELSYVIGKGLGRTHCALCDITHGALREKASWQSCRRELGVPFETVHLDERSPAVFAASDGHTPCILAETDDGLELLLGPDDLEALDGSPERLVEAVVRAAGARDLALVPGRATHS